MYVKFADEAAFRKDFILPFLSRLGFHDVVETHGQREFGKDFVFSELTSFGFLRYHAAQVKHEKSISQTQHSLLEGIVSQVRQAFSVPFRLSDSPRDRHVSSVFVFNSGTISTGAQDFLSGVFAKEHYGDNVHILDGERLSTLSNIAAFAIDRDIRPRLIGLKNQLYLNSRIWQSILDNLPLFRDVRGCMFSAIESYLTQPLPGDEIPANEIALLWQETRIIESINRRHLTGGLCSDEIRNGDIETLRELIGEANKRVSRLRAAVDTALERFQPFDSPQ